MAATAVGGPESKPPAPGPEKGDGSGDAARARVHQAFSLGWNMCLIYRTGKVPGWRTYDSAPEQLPSPRSFNSAELSQIRLGQIRNAIDHFDEQLHTPTGHKSFATAGDHIQKLRPPYEEAPALNPPEPRQCIFEAHLALAEALSASDARFAKAYHLGVSLAAATRSTANFESLQREFKRERIARLGEWLADLASLFPDHSSRVVRLSCAEWQRWVEDPVMRSAEADLAEKEADPNAGSPGAVARIKARATPGTRPLKWEDDKKSVKRALVRQGDIWKALLSGEKEGPEMLELQDYVKTGQRALKDGAKLLRAVLVPALLAVALLILGSWLLVENEGAVATAVGIATVAGALGITWRSIIGSLGAVADKLQGPVWGAALDEQIAVSITNLPSGAQAARKPAKKGAPASGPQPDLLPLSEETNLDIEWADSEGTA
jgi:hypothetical protein